MIKRTFSNKDHVQFRLFRPRTVIYVENDTLFTFTKIGEGASQKRFRLAIIVAGKCDYILMFPHCIKLLARITLYRWLSLVPLGSPWLSLVILVYPWLSLVSFDFNICDFVCAFAII